MRRLTPAAGRGEVWLPSYNGGVGHPSTLPQQRAPGPPVDGGGAARAAWRAARPPKEPRLRARLPGLRVSLRAHRPQPHAPARASPRARPQRGPGGHGAPPPRPRCPVPHAPRPRVPAHGRGPGCARASRGQRPHRSDRRPLVQRRCGADAVLGAIARLRRPDRAPRQEPRHRPAPGPGDRGPGASRTPGTGAPAAHHRGAGA